MRRCRNVQGGSVPRQNGGPQMTLLEPIKAVDSSSPGAAGGGRPISKGEAGRTRSCREPKAYGERETLQFIEGNTQRDRKRMYM